MSMMTLSTLHSKTPTTNPFSPTPLSPIRHSSSNHSLPFTLKFSTEKPPLYKKIQSCNSFYGPLKKNLNGFVPIKKSCCGFLVKAQNGNGNGNGSDFSKEELEARGESSMPERFRLSPNTDTDKPVRWPWLIVVAVMLYAWRTVLWELSNWKRTASAIFLFLGYISKLVLALLFHFIGDPLTSSIRGVETALYSIRAFYSGIIAYAPIPELTTIIILTSIILAIAQATVPDSVNNQPYLLTVSGLIGFAAVRNYISEPFFWTLLVCLFGFAMLVKKRDYVSSALPVAAILAAVGEPWVRVLVMASYLGLAIFHHSRNPSDGKENEGEAVKRVPVPLICAALAIGVRVAAKWAGYRHLTWMVV